jgi:hypothetical protein
MFPFTNYNNDQYREAFHCIHNSYLNLGERWFPSSREVETCVGYYQSYLDYYTSDACTVP